MPSRGAKESIVGLFDEVDRNTCQLGAFHPLTLATINRLATALWDAGDIQQSVDLLEQAIQATVSFAPGERVRCNLLCTLGEAMVEMSLGPGEGNLSRNPPKLHPPVRFKASALFGGEERSRRCSIRIGRSSRSR